MREDLLHYLWKFKKLQGQRLQTTEGEVIEIDKWGMHNQNAGPDFFNARLRIGDQLWAGNVEMHVKASDWYLHGHDDDPAYNNVILHVVFVHDAEITRRDEVTIPVLDLSGYVSETVLKSYRNLFAKMENQFINCENNIAAVDRFEVDFWLEKVYLERLQKRHKSMLAHLDQTTNDWETLFFRRLARSFGTSVNADAFEQIAISIPQNILRKLARDAFQLEAVLMGQAGLLEKELDIPYYKGLKNEFAFAKAKYQLNPVHTPLKFFRLRPPNFPTIRLSQLAFLYHRSPHLFAEILLAKNVKELMDLFDVQAAKFWDTHYVFDKQSKVVKKGLSKNFVQLLIINAVVPVRFAYLSNRGKPEAEDVLDLLRELPYEHNKTTQKFQHLLPWLDNALHSQALLQLKTAYCDPNKCLQCAIGVKLMRR